MDARKLLMLAELDRLGTIAAVARSLHLTAPGVSMQLAALERELGVVLTERQGRRVALTAAGSVLAEHARQIGDLMSVAEMEVSALREGATGRYRVAAFPTIARSLVASAWGRLLAAGGTSGAGWSAGAPGTAGSQSSERQSAGAPGGTSGGAPRATPHTAQPKIGSPGGGTLAPGIRLSLIELEPTDSLPALAGGDVDLAVAHSYSNVPRIDRAGLVTTPLLTEPVYLAGRELELDTQSTRGGADSGVDLREYANADWIVPGREFTCHEMVQRACGLAGFEPRVVAEATDFSVQLAFVAAGAGVALIPQLGAVDVPGGVRLLDLAEPVSRYDYLATRASSAADAGLARLCAALRSEAAAYAR
ncbi:LysR family transcriptional regulator [Subtercola endophyticus]|uniref:LysR family transcriptional regulator n=1 Tax=Subtercola endophyticus TaxID=2895559 RepID=UPI001E5EE6E1|nr:LysR substrate-binding domain-containing protein [Subtercola endophyticus]UFS58857.1 LysR substrate-binding domain-containing protein [Subtercola endophyticus]